MITIKKILSATLLVITLPFGSSNATEMSYNFTARINSGMYEYDAASQTISYVTESTFPGTKLAIGDVITGRFSYQSSAQLSSSQPNPQSYGTYQMYNDIGANSGINFSINGGDTTYRSSPGSGILVANNASTFSGYDIFSIQNSAAYSFEMFQIASINLFDNSGLVFDNSNIPENLLLQDFSYAALSGTWVRQNDGNQLQFAANFTSLTRSSEIPEPASYLLTIGGLGIISLMRRRAT